MSNTTTCPRCQRPLRVPESLIGQQVKCPACNHTFASVLDEEGPGPPHETRREELRVDRRRREEGREDDRPRRRPRDERDKDGRPRRRRRRYDEHRGTLILILGILPFLIHPLAPVCGPIAWFLGNHDIKEIRAGRMDPEGENSTQVGRILGMVFTLLSLLVILLGCLVVSLIALAAGRK
jgi:predicted Zn finger-like uncharacterized protein